MDRPDPPLPEPRTFLGRVLRPFLILAGLALVFTTLSALSDGDPIITVLTGPWLRSMMGGALAASLAYAVANPGPHVDSVPGRVQRFVLTWMVPGAWFAVGGWVTALLTVETLPSYFDEWGEQPWLLWIGIGALAGFAAGAFVWRIWPPEPLESDELADERTAWSQWAAAGLAVLLVVPVLITAYGTEWQTREERQQRQMLEAGARVNAMMHVQEMRAIAPPGTPAAVYADSVVAHFAGHLSGWYAEPLIHRVTNPILMGSPAVEVVFSDGRVQGVLPASGRAAGDSVPPAEVAERLGLPVDHPVFRLTELGAAPDTR